VHQLVVMVGVGVRFRDDDAGRMTVLMVLVVDVGVVVVHGLVDVEVRMVRAEEQGHADRHHDA
jgi:hypothetical protein